MLFVLHFFAAHEKRSMLNSKQDSTFSCVVYGATIFFSIACLLTDDARARRGGFLSALLANVAGKAIGRTVGAALSTKTYGPDVLTPQQLEQCVLRAKVLDENSVAVESEVESTKAVANRAKILKAQLEMMNGMVDTSSALEVANYNRRVDEFNSLVHVYDTAFEAYKIKEVSFNASVSEYNSSCTKKYYIDDMQTVKSKLGLN
jgi:hypothetical protein